MIECTDEIIYYKKNKRKLRKNKKIFRWFTLLFVVVMIFCYQRFFIADNLIYVCSDYLKATSIQKINDSVLVSLENDLNYNSFIDVQKNENGDIVLISANSLKVNSVSRKITELSKLTIDQALVKGVPVPWLSFTGIGFLSGYGKEVYIKTVNVSSVNCEFLSTFSSVGINQTLLSIYANVICDISLDVPLNRKTISSSTKILLCESVLLGKVPDFYLGKNLF